MHRALPHIWADGELVHPHTRVALERVTKYLHCTR